MNLDILGNWKGGAIKDAGDEAIRKHGKDALNNIDIGLLESAYGANPDHVRNYIKSQQQGALNDSRLRERAINAGLTGADGAGGADYGDTQGTYLSKIVNQEKAVKTQERQRLRTEKKEDNTTALNNQLAVGQQSIDAQAAQFKTQLESQQNQFAHTAGEQAKDRALTRDLANQSEDFKMQMAFMNSDLQDKRMAYDRETRSMDKRDRMIAQLMSGLGQLGGAFAL